MNLSFRISRYTLLTVLFTASGVGVATAASGDTAYGNNALASNTSGFDNSAFGDSALFENTSGYANTAVGQGALYESNGYGNTALGSGALFENTNGTYNSATGLDALFDNTTGTNNTANGLEVLTNNTTGSYNSGLGSSALYKNKTGTKNTAVGGSSLYNNTGGTLNVAVGTQALFGNTTGTKNIGIGQQAAYYPTTGSNNIEIGAAGAASDNAVIRIGTQGTQTKTYMAGIRGTNVTGGVAVMVTSTGQLGVISSSRRYKEDIRSMGDVSDRLLALRPVTFRYKQADEKGQKPEQYGLIAEEVAKVMPELVIYNDHGQPETVAYQALTPLLLNEIKREHDQVVSLTRRVESQGELLRSVTTQRAELESLKSELAEFRRSAGIHAASGEN